MIATDSNVKRLFQQLQDAAKDGFANPTPRSYAFGLAISFATTTFLIAKALADDPKRTLLVEEAQKCVICDAVKDKTLNITCSIPRKKDKSVDDAHYRHLRNCFAHGNWKYDESEVT